MIRRRATRMKKDKSPIDRGLGFVADQTFQLKEELWADNLAENMPVVRPGRDIRELPKLNGSSTIVVGAGPSVDRHDHLRLLKEIGYGGAIVACDKALVPCLKAGVTPDIVISVDGAQAISKFFDDPVIAENGRTKAALNVTAHPDTLAKVPYERYFLMTSYDDPFGERSITRLIHFMTRKTILSSFGNVGGQAVNLAMFLGANPVVMVGMDYGYPGNTPPEKTSYYRSYKWLAEKRKKKIGDYFTKIRNPDTGEEVMLDLNWSVYRELFLRHMRVMKKKMRVVNCSPTSSLFGEGIEFVPLEEALKKWPR